MSRSYGKDMSTKHKDDCKRVFKNYDATCPRCQELAAGEKPRAGWSDNKRIMEAQRRRAIAIHFAPGGRHEQITAAGGVDTAFDW